MGPPTQQKLTPFPSPSKKLTDELKVFQAPAIYTFRAKNDFAEDSLFRHIEPSHAFHLDLVRFLALFVCHCVNVCVCANIT